MPSDGGFLAPVLTSTGQGSHVALFSYYVLLNGGILAIAWFKSFRLASQESPRMAPAPDVVIGAARPVAGEAALRAPLVSDWKPVLLWSVLALASLVLVLVARAALASGGPNA